MDRTETNNYVKLCGVMAAGPVFSHSSRGLAFYLFPLTVARLSGNSDTVNILVREEQLTALEPGENSKLCVVGEIRSFNSRRSTGARLVITVLARELSFCDDKDGNLVELTGTLCKEPNLRTTPMGREICDLMLAVNRHYGRSDYLPCICWGIRAREAARGYGSRGGSRVGITSNSPRTDRSGVPLSRSPPLTSGSPGTIKDGTALVLAKALTTLRL